LGSNQKSPQSHNDFFDISNSEWKLTIDSLEDIILLLDGEGKIIRGNRNIENWKLGKISKIMNTPFNKILHPNCTSPKCYLRRCWPTAKTRLDKKKIYKFEANDGLLNRYLQYTFRPLAKDTTLYGKKSKAFSVLIIRDITTQKAATERLQKFTVEMRDIFNVLQEQCVHLDADGIIIAIDGYSEIPKLNRQSIGIPLEDIMPESCKADCSKAITEVRKNKNVITVEETLEIKKGIQIFEYIFLSVHQDEILIIIKNITEKRRMESLAQKVELMNNLGVVFSSLRHEIGNPINSIKMTVTVLSENLKKYSPEKIDEYIQRIQEEINRIEFLLKNLKSFSMWEDCQLNNVQLKDFMKNFIALIKRNLKTMSIKIVVSWLNKIDTVLTDPRALHQVLLNIINNAIDALENQSNPMIFIKIKKDMDRVIILIEDNGPGISKSLKEKIFNPFYTTKKEGTGLGLLITQKILSRIDGSIEINSKKNKGTSVTINIPEGKCA